MNVGGDRDSHQKEPVHSVIPASTSTPIHSARPARPHKKALAAILGAMATIAAIVVGSSALMTSGKSMSSGLTSANLITVSARIPMSASDLAALVGRNLDFGPLTDPKRRASCLNGLGYPASMQVLGAAPMQINGAAAIVLVMPGDHPDELIALAVPPSCSSVSTGLIADTTVSRP